MQYSNIYSDLDIEFNTLGLLMRKDNLIKAMSLGLEELDFTIDKNKDVYKLLSKCLEVERSTDIAFLLNLASKFKVEREDLYTLYQETLIVSDISPYLNKLFELRANRDFLNLSEKIKSGNLDTLEMTKEIDSINELKDRAKRDDIIISLDRVEYFEINKLERVPTGLESIDRMLKGFFTGTLNIITGYSGAGKSTLINQMCIAESLVRNYKVFLFSGELSNQQLKMWLSPTLCGKKYFDDNSKLKESSTKIVDRYLKDKLLTYSDDSGIVTDRRLLNDMTRLVKRGVRVFIIDNLMKVELTGEDKNQLLAQRRFINDLKVFAKKHNVIVHLIAHPRKPVNGDKISKYDVAGSSDITNLADTVMIVYRITEEDKAKDESFIGYDAAIKVVKDRTCGNSDFTKLFKFDKDRKRFYGSSLELDRDYIFLSDMTKVNQEEIRLPEWRD